MPLTSKGEKILENMKTEYGSEKGKEVFYASKNAGKISGVDSSGAFLGPEHAPLSSGMAGMPEAVSVQQLAAESRKRSGQ